MTDVSHITTHVLDASEGVPAGGVAVTLAHESGGWSEVATRRTDDDGRITDLGPAALAPGLYRLTFETGAYFAARDRSTFYPRIDVTVEVVPHHGHLHVPILLSPFAFTTYRGS